MPRPPAPTRGRRNCSRCRRWRPVIDFPLGRTRLKDGTPLDPPQASSWCEPCRREAARRRARLRYAREKERRRQGAELSLRRWRRRVARGEAVWVGPFARWLREEAIPRHGLRLLAEWGGVDEKRIRVVAAEQQPAVPIVLVDRLLLEEGNTLLDDLYPVAA